VGRPSPCGASPRRGRRSALSPCTRAHRPDPAMKRAIVRRAKLYYLLREWPARRRASRKAGRPSSRVGRSPAATPIETSTTTSASRNEPCAVTKPCRRRARWSAGRRRLRLAISWALPRMGPSSPSDSIELPDRFERSAWRRGRTPLARRGQACGSPLWPGPVVAAAVCCPPAARIHTGRGRLESGSSPSAGGPVHAIRSRAIACAVGNRLCRFNDHTRPASISRGHARGHARGRGGARCSPSSS